MITDTFSALLRRHRERRGLHQGQVATGICVRSYISRLEAGKREPSRETVLALATVLDVCDDDLDDLLAAAGYLPSSAWPVRAVLARLDGLSKAEQLPDGRCVVAVARWDDMMPILTAAMLLALAPRLGGPTDGGYDVILRAGWHDALSRRLPGDTTATGTQGHCVARD